jgi:hypothetical protein
VRERWSAAPIQSFAAATADLTSAGSGTRAFSVGIEQNVNPNTSVESEYLVSGVGNGTDIDAAIGVRQRLFVTPVLKGDAFVQHGTGIGSDGASFDAYGLTLAYGDTAGRFKATGSLQDRTGSTAGATWSLGAAGKLTTDVALIGAYQGSRALTGLTTDARVALAWRPSKSDRGALLAGYERSAGNAGGIADLSGIVSLDGVYRPMRGLELLGRYADKVDGATNSSVGTSLVELGAREKIAPRLDIGFEARDVFAPNAGGAIHSTAAEFGFLPGGTLRAAFGYNFGTAADPALAAAPTRRGFYATLTTTIDRIFGWGGH